MLVIWSSSLNSRKLSKVPSKESESEDENPSTEATTILQEELQQHQLTHSRENLLEGRMHWVILMLFYSVTKFSIFSLLNVMNQFMIEQLWDLIEIYCQSKEKKIKLIFIFVGTLISKIGVFGAQKSHTSSYRSHGPHDEWLVCADCAAEASLAVISLKKRTT